MDLREDEERIRRWLCESDIESNHDEVEELSESENEDNMVADAHVGTDESEEEGSMSSDEEIFVSRRSRKRRFVGQLGFESIQHQQEPQEPESSFVIRYNKITFMERAVINGLLDLAIHEQEHLLVM
ncbi:unnamed protein product [Parnassius apollo]|uniref:(apollo) hypothetical protein n=1 Tax=Parnassius apollo TaxID=110799 RepID=A0A8S3XV29_PARAO|nr:unnamed protein product [Parnassius apollo]